MSLIHQEEQDDQSMKNQFKEAWPRTPSSEANAQLKASANAFYQKLTAASQADGIVKSRMEQYMPQLDILASKVMTF
jgi:hypothetical protein